MRAMTDSSRAPLPVGASADLAAARASSNGLAATAGSFIIWGMFPLYLRALAVVPALQIVAHRVSWACVLILGWMSLRGELPSLRQALMRKGVLPRLAAAAVLISLNWLAYVWAVANDRVVETSLGYFIN